MPGATFSWLVKMAWRDSRRNRNRLLLFVSSIVLGIAALVAINSFSENLQRDIQKESKSLLGADLVLESTSPMDSVVTPYFVDLADQQSSSVNFVSMVLFPKSGGTRLAFIQALEGDFPYYGRFNTSPESAYRTFKGGRRAVVDKNLMLQFGLEVGDSVKIGAITFTIEGQLNSVPGRAGISSSVAPLVVIPMSELEGTGLVQKGSRIEYQYYYQMAEELDVNNLVDTLRARNSELAFSATTVKERRENLGESFADMNTFLNLIGFIALLLGCIGVASAVHIYVKEKLGTVAILRTLGTSGRQAFLIYLLQITVMGLLGSIFGAILGSTLQVVLPMVFGEFLPVENVSTDISWFSIGKGIITGLGIAILFALLPLLSIRRTSPLRTLRVTEDVPQGNDPWRWVVYILIAGFIGGFTFWQTSDIQTALFFTVGIGLAFLLLAGAALLLMWLVRRFFPVKWNYVWRQSIANLYRPNNQTLTLMVSIGLGSALISTLFFTQELLLKQVELTGADSMPNMILFDIQPEQREGVIKLTEDYDLPMLQKVPIVTMRLNSIDGIDKQVNLRDTSSEISTRVYNREYRVTYRDTLIDSETIIDGEWHGDKADDGIVYISLAENIARSMNAEVGTRLVFNVQGLPVETEVSSIRKIEWNRIQTNFFVVFPTGILERAPQFNVIVTRVPSTETSAAFQQDLVKSYPNVSIVDLALILKSLDEVLSKVSFVIRFMALFSILTGLLVLISSVIISKYQRIRESVLLRTIGANGRQILLINALEYFMIGALATLTGIFLAFLGSWLLATFSFEIPFVPNLWPALIVFFGITGLTILIGLFNSRDVLNKPPLEVLRAEV